MTRELPHDGMYVEEGLGRGNASPTDDGKVRTGTLWTVSAHIITAVIGSGVLSLAWAFAQLGWIAGPIILLAFALITYMTSAMLAGCYRAPITGKRNYCYSQVVESYLGGYKIQLCRLAQYTNCAGVTIGYTITAAISMVAFMRSNCYHKYGHQADCHTSHYSFMAIFGALQIILCQIPNFHKLSWLSILAAVMSFSYSSIGFGLAIAMVIADGGSARTGLTGTEVGVDVTKQEKMWRCFQAIGNMAFAYAYSIVLVEIQDTLKPDPPETEVMKKASLLGVSTTTVFYLLCGCFGYAAFGNNAPGDFLTDFGFYEPYWLVDFANICIAVHLIGAYQVFIQPLFQFVEEKANNSWPESKFVTQEYHMIGTSLNLFRLIWRTTFVIISTLIAMIFPFFNAFLGLLGALAFWPLAVYFPIEMHIVRTKMKPWTTKWIMLKIVILICLAICVVAGVGSIQGLIKSVSNYKPFAPTDH